MADPVITTTRPAAEARLGPLLARPRAHPRAASILALLLFAAAPALPQAGAGHTLLGDVKINEDKAVGLKPISLDVILYALDGRVFSRQRISSGGRYRFFGVRSGEYDLVVEVENQEAAAGSAKRLAGVVPVPRCGLASMGAIRDV